MFNARLEKLKYLCKDNPYYEPLVKKLSKDEFRIIDNFIIDNSHLDSRAFKAEALILFLDKQKTTHWTIIEDILIAIG